MIFRQPALSSLFYFQDPIGQSLLVIDPGVRKLWYNFRWKTERKYYRCQRRYIKDILKIKLNKYSLKSDELKTPLLSVF